MPTTAHNPKAYNSLQQSAYNRKVPKTKGLGRKRGRKKDRNIIRKRKRKVTEKKGRVLSWASCRLKGNDDKPICPKDDKMVCLITTLVMGQSDLASVVQRTLS